ncbi:hypothetical protein KKC_14160, partial [Listeria fleischmannii subsp. coloradonensis]
MKVGNGLEDVDAGPLIRADAIDKILEQLEDAKKKGAKILLGGKRLTGAAYDNGFFFMPTVLDDVTQKMTIFYEETFGPVIPLITFETDDEAIQMANDCEFGLASYFFTKSVARVEEVSDQLEYGMVGVNEIATTQGGTNRDFKSRNPIWRRETFRLWSRKWPLRSRRIYSSEIRQFKLWTSLKKATFHRKFF